MISNPQVTELAREIASAPNEVCLGLLADQLYWLTAEREEGLA